MTKSESLVEACPVDVDRALMDWEYVRGGGTKNWQLDFSRPLASGEVDLETARQVWRARQVEEAIGSFGQTRYVQRMVSDLMLFVVNEPDRGLEVFRGVPRGTDGIRVLRDQVKAVREAVEARLRAGEGYPQSARAAAL